MLRLVVFTAIFMTSLASRADAEFDSFYITRFVMNCASNHEQGLSYQSVRACACALDIFRHRGYNRRSIDYALTDSDDSVDRETEAIIQRRCIQPVKTKPTKP